MFVKRAGMASNHGQRIAKLKSPRKIMVWEKKGTLQTAVNNPVITLEVNFATSDPANPLDNSGRAQNPS
jgi:hypothetical protein